MIRCTLNPEEFAQVSAKLQESEGITLSGSSGEIDHEGVKASYSFNGSELLITVTKAPFLLSKTYCETRIASAMREQDLNVQTVG